MVRTGISEHPWWAMKPEARSCGARTVNAVTDPASRSTAATASSARDRLVIRGPRRAASTGMRATAAVTSANLARVAVLPLARRQGLGDLRPYGRSSPDLPAVSDRQSVRCGAEQGRFG